MFKVGRAKLNCSVEEQNDNKYLTKGNIHKCGQSVKWIVLFCFFSILLLHNRALIDERFSTPREKDDQHEYILLFQSLHRPHNLNLSCVFYIYFAHELSPPIFLQSIHIEMSVVCMYI